MMMIKIIIIINNLIVIIFKRYAQLRGTSLSL